MSDLNAATTTRPKSLLSVTLIRDLSILVFIVVVTWKLLNAQLSINFDEFSFNDFLSLVLALFSVGLSVAFYFKANDASNQFYDNTYKFTKEMSEILGRIEAGFGERLRHLDEGYSGVRERLDKLPYANTASLAEVAAEEEEIKRKENEQKAVIEDLAKRAKLAEHEKQALFKNLEEKNSELERARDELRSMQESRNRSKVRPPLEHGVISFVAKKLRNSAPDEDFEMMPISRLQEFFEENKDLIVDIARNDMRKLGLLDSDEKLTRDGARSLRLELVRIQSRERI